MKVVEWIDREEAEGKECSIGGMGGWFNAGHIHKGETGRIMNAGTGHRWADYIESLPEEERIYAEAIRESILETGMKITGDMHQEEYIPLFDDGTIGDFSFRGWGDLMAAIFSEEDDRDYTYMDFYYIYWHRDE